MTPVLISPGMPGTSSGDSSVIGSGIESAEALHEAMLRTWQDQTPEWKHITLPHPDIFFVGDSQQAPSIAQIRLFSQELRYPPHQLPQKLFVIWRLDEASIPAQNALLKDLEEPPAYAHLVITATQRARILPTIHSRTQAFTAQIDNRVGNQMDTQNDQPDQSTDIVQFCDPRFWQKQKISELITLAAKYSQRETAIPLVYGWIQTVLKQPTYPTPQLREMLEILQEAHLALQANANVPLALETCFFRLHTVQNMV